jgi:hypothetical protein
MSEFWDIGCKDCNVEAGAFHANHGDDHVLKIVPLLPAIAQLGAVDLDVHAYWCEWMSWPSLVNFAKEHAGHSCAPRSEYGYWLGEPKPWERST